MSHWPVNFSVPGNIHSGVSGNDSIMATGVFSARELMRVTRRKYNACSGIYTQHCTLYLLYLLPIGRFYKVC